MRHPLLAIMSMSLIISVIGVGCRESEPENPLPPRPIAWTQVTAKDPIQIRHVSGMLVAEEKAFLSFEVGGKVDEVTAKLGDSVVKGQPLARLDTTNYQLNVNAAKASVEEAKANLNEANNEFERQANLKAKGFASQAVYDNAKAALDTAKSGVDVAVAQLALNQKNLNDTRLLAPYAGKITSRLIEPSQQIRPGEACFEIEGEQGLEVSLLAPETLVTRINTGEAFDVTFVALPGVIIPGIVTEISTKAEAANAFPMTLLLQDRHQKLRAGMSAEVAFSYQTAAKPSGPIVSIPPSAILAGKDNTTYVFVYDKTSGTVKKTPVETQNIRNNSVYIAKGLAPGDIVAKYGVAFLQDGQAVTLLGEGAAQYQTQ